MLNFSNHKQFKKLVELINQPNKYENIWEVIEVSGVPIEFINDIVGIIDKSFITTTTYPNDLEKYVNSIIEYQKDDTKYSELVRELNENGLEPVERVSSKGEFSVRGDVITLWPSLYQYPLKINFWGDDIESCEIFDIAINRKISDVEHFYLGDEALIEESIFSLQLTNLDHQTTHKVIHFNQFSLESDINFDFRQPRLFFHRFDLLKDYIKKHLEHGYEIKISTTHPEEIPEEFSEYITKEQFPAGIISKELKVLALTDREIFGTIFLQNEVLKNSSSSTSRKMLAQFEGEVSIGDYVVHEDHGIGIYSGIVQEESSFDANQQNNYIQIKYAKSDELLVPLNMVYKITKYIGVDGQKPELTGLGKVQWQNLTKKIKTSVKILASELVNHYAKMSIAKADALNNEDSAEYKKFVDRFEFEETDDQLRSINEVMNDLEQDKPMNRILIGDVGFGKTEVILRAAFKAVESGKQVAILSPTTVLASQHLKTFSERFEGFPYKVAALSRFNNKYENKEITEQITEGKIDIAIGTHRLLSNDIEFEDLGLIVIDEEQKFGVKQKEKLKKLQYGVHVLTTTATPIPRTLSMALSTIQDISTIQTPPQGRKAVKVEVSKMNWNKIINSIKTELAREGQIYIIHNSVKTINSIAAKIKSFIPDLKLAIAHGQMPSEKLEKRMYDFFNKKYDCLLCTTIVENGIDMKNVNTLIVLKSQNFGLSQLYQLKGRVGRSDRQAYSYFFYDGEELEAMDIQETDSNEEIKRKDKTYLKRLKALAEADELGAGFDIATKDLEIRGAGNLLGGEQHGHISKIGFGLYMQMLAQEIERLKNSHKP